METINISLSEGVIEVPTTSRSICHQERPLDVVSEELQHIRLGHINYSNVEKVLEDIGTEYCRITREELKKLLYCSAYILGKIIRRRFNRKKKPSIYSDKVFELIYIDTTEILIFPKGYRYFVQFTDDYSRRTQTYSIKKKGEALERLKQFNLFVKRQFGAEIKRILTDNGRELRPIAYYLKR